MEHIVLLGDSILANKAYVKEKDVIKWLKELLPKEWKATLKAIDGSVAKNVKQQIEDLPNDSSFLVISVGGNNALQELFLLEQPVKTISDALLELSFSLQSFEQEYNEMLKTVLEKNISTALCTIYYPNFPDMKMQKLALSILSIYNDCIIRSAFVNKLPLIDLRLVCNSPLDYANSIEPSDEGGRKIANIIFRLVSNCKSGFLKEAIFF